MHDSLLRKANWPSLNVLFFYFIPIYIHAQDTTLVDVKIFSSPIISMTGDEKGNIWFNTRFDLYYFDGKSIKWEKKLPDRRSLTYTKGKLKNFGPLYEGDPSIRDSLVRNLKWTKYLPNVGAIVFTAKDKNGITWVTSGLHLFGFEIHQNFKRTLIGHSLRGILEFEGNFFINSYSGLFINDSLIQADLSSNGNILALSPGKIWITPTDINHNKYTSVIKYDYKHGTFVNLPFPNETPVRIDYLHKTSKSIWAASDTDGLFRIVHDSIKPTGFTKPVAYLTHSDNTLYLATREGIFCAADNKFYRWKSFPPLTFNSIQKIENTWWAASSNGLWYWNPSMKHALKIFPNTPLGQMETYGVLQDKAGYFWVSTNAGIHRFKPDNAQYKSYLTNLEFNKRSFIHIRDSFYFGSINGLISFNPLKFPPDTYLKTDKQPPINLQWIIYFVCAILFVSFIFIYIKWKKAKRQLAEVFQNQNIIQQDPFKDNLEQFIKDNLSTVTVRSLSAYAGISERSLYLLLNEKYQLKPGSLIRNIKLARIKHLITDKPDISRAEIAQEVGYSLNYVAQILDEDEELSPTK